MKLCCKHGLKKLVLYLEKQEYTLHQRLFKVQDCLIVSAKDINFALLLASFNDNLIHRFREINNLNLLQIMALIFPFVLSFTSKINQVIAFWQEFKHLIFYSLLSLLFTFFLHLQTFQNTMKKLEFQGLFQFSLSFALFIFDLNLSFHLIAFFIGLKALFSLDSSIQERLHLLLHLK